MQVENEVVSDNYDNNEEALEEEEEVGYIKIENITEARSLKPNLIYCSTKLLPFSVGLVILGCPLFFPFSVLLACSFILSFLIFLIALFFFLVTFQFCLSIFFIHFAVSFFLSQFVVSFPLFIFHPLFLFQFVQVI